MGTLSAAYERAVQSRDPYADCECGHGRHTHVRYVGACGLCDCPAVRPASPLEGQEESND